MNESVGRRGERGAVYDARPLFTIMSANSSFIQQHQQPCPPQQRQAERPRQRRGHQNRRGAQNNNRANAQQQRANRQPNQQQPQHAPRQQPNAVAGAQPANFEAAPSGQAQPEDLPQQIPQQPPIGQNGDVVAELVQPEEPDVPICAICFEPMLEDGPPTYTLDHDGHARHTFHHHCLERYHHHRWSNVGPPREHNHEMCVEGLICFCTVRCPVCRHEIPGEESFAAFNHQYFVLRAFQRRARQERPHVPIAQAPQAPADAVAVLGRVRQGAPQHNPPPPPPGNIPNNRNPDLPIENRDGRDVIVSLGNVQVYEYVEHVAPSLIRRVLAAIRVVAPNNVALRQQVMPIALVQELASTMASVNGSDQEYITLATARTHEMCRNLVLTPAQQLHIHQYLPYIVFYNYRHTLALRFRAQHVDNNVFGTARRDIVQPYSDIGSQFETYVRYTLVVGGSLLLAGAAYFVGPTAIKSLVHTARARATSAVTIIHRRLFANAYLVRVDQALIRHHGIIEGL